MLKNLQKMIKDRLNRDTLYCQAEYWNSKAEVMRGHAVSMWPNNELNELFHADHVQTSEVFLGDVNEKRILDIGCGTGRMSRYFAKKGAFVHGFDFSSKSIEIARSLSKGANPSYEVLSLFDLEKENTYDIALSWAVLTVACKDEEELEKGLKLVNKALKPAGRLLMLEPVHSGFLHRVLKMNIKRFVQVLEQQSFSIQQIKHLHCWPVRLTLAYVPWPAWITSPVYRAGEMFMNLTKRRMLGDYKAILAVTRKPVSF